MLRRGRNKDLPKLMMLQAFIDETSCLYIKCFILWCGHFSSYCSFWRAASALLLLLLNISPGAMARKEKGFTEADDAASLYRQNILFVIKCFILWCGPFFSSYCSFWIAASALLLLLLNISPDATARKEKGFTEADDAASFYRRNVLFVNKVLHTVMWSFLLVLLFILKSLLGTTSSLVEYFSRRYGEEGKRIYQSWWCCKLLTAKRPVCK